MVLAKKFYMSPEFDYLSTLDKLKNAPYYLIDGITSPIIKPWFIAGQLAL